MTTYLVTILLANGRLRTVEVRAESISHSVAAAMAEHSATNVYSVIAR